VLKDHPVGLLAGPPQPIPRTRETPWLIMEAMMKVEPQNAALPAAGDTRLIVITPSLVPGLSPPM